VWVRGVKKLWVGSVPFFSSSSSFFFFFFKLFYFRLSVF
jgi:hypothetical protein